MNGGRHILFDNAFLAGRYFTKYMFLNNKILYQPLDLEVLESLINLFLFQADWTLLFFILIT